MPPTIERKGNSIPCHTVRNSTVEIGKLNPELLIAALTALGLTPIHAGNIIRFGRGESYDIATGKMNLGVRYSTNEIKQAYSAEAVKSQAKKFGWKLTEDGPNQYTAIR